ncbi:protein jagunal homolog 1-B-like [Tubulanus polymorphus]|uniref:protein jagunal homolog 1-B-like n=1 Tax=Tubulanus polymorphus TaxID=672921 RepID=UPI003DA61E11
MMSFRQGEARPSGSDGSDFAHRERVAMHYKISVLNKSRLKKIGALHASLFVLVLVSCLESLMKAVNMKPPAAVLDLRLPAAEPWQFMWLISITSTVFGLLSLSKNASVLLKQCIVGNVVFGIMPVTYAVFYKGYELMDFVKERKVKAYVLGFPYVVLMFIFLTIAIQIHMFAIYFSMQLLKSWRSTTTNKKKK